AGTHITVNLDGWRVVLPIPFLPRKDYGVVPDYDERPAYPAGHEFTERYRNWKERWSEFSARRKTAHHTISGTLSSIRSVEGLVKLWPEVEPFAAPFTGKPAPKPQPLAICTGELNNLFNLPVGRSTK